MRRNTFRICDSPLLRAARCSFTRHRNRDEITVLVCEQKPYPLWFSCRHKLKPSGIAWTPIQYVTDSTFEIGPAQLCCVTEIETNSPFLYVNVQKPYSIWFSCRHELKLSTIVWTPIQYLTLYLRDWSGTTSLRYRNRAELTVLMYEQRPYPWI